MDYAAKCKIFLDKMKDESQASRVGPIGARITATAYDLAFSLYGEGQKVNVVFASPRSVVCGELREDRAGRWLVPENRNFPPIELDRTNIEFIKPKPARFLLTWVDIFPLEKPEYFETLDGFVYDGQLVGRWGFSDEAAAREFYNAKLAEAETYGVLVPGESITIKLYENGRMIRKGEVAR